MADEEKRRNCGITDQLVFRISITDKDGRQPPHHPTWLKPRITALSMDASVTGGGCDVEADANNEIPWIKIAERDVCCIVTHCPFHLILTEVI